MDEIGCAVNKYEDLIPNLRKIFDCLWRSGLKLSPEKCDIATNSMKFLGNVITSKGISPQSEKITQVSQ